MQPITVTEAAYESWYRHFRLCVLALDPPHVFRAALGCQPIHRPNRPLVHGFRLNFLLEVSAIAGIIVICRYSCLTRLRGTSFVRCWNLVLCLRHQRSREPMNSDCCTLGLPSGYRVESL